jgi:hypothetical protein
MILVGAIVLGLLLQPATLSQAANNQPVGPPGEREFTPGSVPAAGTEAALRRLVAGLASGSPDYDKLSSQFAQVVRRDLPMTHPLFSSMGELKSVTFLGRGEMGDDVYNLVFAKGGAIMSTALDAGGRMTGGILRPMGPPGERVSVPTAGTEAALRRLVAGLASGSQYRHERVGCYRCSAARIPSAKSAPCFSSMKISPTRSRTGAQVIWR